MFSSKSRCGFRSPWPFSDPHSAAPGVPGCCASRPPRAARCVPRRPPRPARHGVEGGNLGEEVLNFMMKVRKWSLFPRDMEKYITYDWIINQAGKISWTTGGYHWKLRTIYIYLYINFNPPFRILNMAHLPLPKRSKRSRNAIRAPALPVRRSPSTFPQRSSCLRFRDGPGHRVMVPLPLL